MKKIMTWLILVLIISGSAPASTITANDDATGGNSYGNCQGFAIDFDTTPPAAAFGIVC